MWPTQSSRLLEPGPGTQSHSAAPAASHNLPVAGMRTNRCPSGAQSGPDVRCQICLTVEQCWLGHGDASLCSAAPGQLKKLQLNHCKVQKQNQAHTHFSPIDYQQRQVFCLGEHSSAGWRCIFTQIHAPRYAHRHRHRQTDRHRQRQTDTPQWVSWSVLENIL